MMSAMKSMKSMHPSIALELKRVKVDSLDGDCVRVEWGLNSTAPTHPGLFVGIGCLYWP